MRRDEDEDEDDDVGYDDGEDGEDVDGRACDDLFDSSVTHDDATAALCAARDVYGFDLRAYVARDDGSGEWEFYGAMKVLNYARATAARARRSTVTWRRVRSHRWFVTDANEEIIKMRCI